MPGDSNPSSFIICLFESPNAMDIVQDNLTNSTQQSHSSQTKYVSPRKYKISRKSVQWEPSCFMQTERRTENWHDETNSRFSQFCERALKQRVQAVQGDNGLFCKNNMGRIKTLRNKCRVFGVKPVGTSSYQ